MLGFKKGAAASAIPPVGKNGAAESNVSKTPAPPQATSPAGGTKQLSAEEAQRRAAASVARMSVAFAQVVSVLMRSALHKHFSLADLEWLVVPPLIAGQLRVAEARSQADSPGVPVAVVLWASVSAELDKRLSENLGSPIRLRPDEWKSGDILWLVEAVGDQRVVPSLLKELGEKTFKGRRVKMRVRGADGKPAIRTLADTFGDK